MRLMWVRPVIPDGTIDEYAANLAEGSELAQ